MTLQKRQKMRNLMVAAVSCMLCILLHQIAAEEQSLLTNAQVLSTDNDTYYGNAN